MARAIYIFKGSFWLQSRDRGWGSTGVGDQLRGSRLWEWKEGVGLGVGGEPG